MGLEEARERYTIQISSFVLFYVMTEQDFGFQFRNEFFQIDFWAS